MPLIHTPINWPVIPPIVLVGTISLYWQESTNLMLLLKVIALREKWNGRIGCKRIILSMTCMLPQPDLPLINICNKWFFFCIYLTKVYYFGSMRIGHTQWWWISWGKRKFGVIHKQMKRCPPLGFIKHNKNGGLNLSFIRFKLDMR